MRVRFRIGSIVFLVLLGYLQQTSTAQTPQNLSGTWALNLGRRTLLVLSLRPVGLNSEAYTGSLARPTHLASDDGVSFSHVEGPTEIEPVVASGWKGDALSITVQNPQDSSDKTVYLISLRDTAHADLRIDGIPLPPIHLIRAKEGVTVSSEWRSGQIYSPDDDPPSNAEMKRIFDDDQSAREPGAKIPWSEVLKADTKRRAETMKLLNEGALRSGEDFELAANIFQHGGDPNDFLLAHTLAIVALRKGYSAATWIAAATLDRYLQSIEQPQIYGTQFSSPEGKPTTQEPYNSTLISDTLRTLLMVPNLAAQKAQSQKYDSQRHIESVQKP